MGIVSWTTTSANVFDVRVRRIRQIVNMKTNQDKLLKEFFHTVFSKNRTKGCTFKNDTKKIKFHMHQTKNPSLSQVDFKSALQTACIDDVKQNGQYFRFEHAPYHDCGF